MFYFQADKGHHEHFIRNADVVVMNVDVVELSASSKKHTFSDASNKSSCCHCGRKGASVGNCVHDGLQKLQ